ncbi:MAG: hypothetical protein HYU66_24520 [Armatimonadetes bacterium]|nr:hypothetical protein [Armatimonadota bacterium]
MDAVRPDEPRRDALAELTCHLALLAAIAVLLWPVVCAGRAPLPDYLLYFRPWADGTRPRTPWNPLYYDAVGQYWPWRTLLHNGLRGNALPYWNPYQFCGYSFVGNGQSALFYPVNWVFFGLFSVANGFRLSALLHLQLAASGTYRVVRELGGGRAAGLTAGLSFALGGFMVSWLMLPTLVSSAAWLPVAVACLERARRTGEVRWGAAAGLAIGMSALAGHPQIFHYVAVTSLSLGAIRLWRRRDTPTACPSPANDHPTERTDTPLACPYAAWALAVAVGGLLSAAPLLPVLELAPRSHRPPGKSDAGYQAFLGRSVPADRLATLFLPRYFGSGAKGAVQPDDPLPGVRDGLYWGMDRQGAISPGDYSEFCVYVGVVTLLLALHSLLFGDGAARTYAGIGVVALVMAFGAFPNRWLYFLLPGFSAGAGPCRLAMVWCFGASVAAGMAVHRLCRHRSVGATLVVARPGLAGVTSDVDGRPQGSPLRQPAVVAAIALALLCLAVGLARSTVHRNGLDLLLEVASYRHLLGTTWLVVLLTSGVVAILRAPRLLPALVAADLLAFGWGFNPSCATKLLDPLPPALAPWAARLGPTDRLLVDDRPRDWGFYRPPPKLGLPPNLATAAGLREFGGYDSLMPAAAKQRAFEMSGGKQPCPAINGNMLLLGDADPCVPEVTLTNGARAIWPVPDESGVIRVPGSPGRLDPGERLLVDTCNRVVIEGAGATLLRDAGYPGWHAYGPDGALLPQRQTAFERHATSPDGPVRWVYAPATVRVGLFLALCGLALASASVAPGTKHQAPGTRHQAPGTGKDPPPGG